MPQFKTLIDEVPVHFQHIRGKGPNPIPLILTHGWPWTFWDMRKIIGPLTDPAAYGGDPADAFEVIAPSLPGFAFSSPLVTEGIFFNTTADIWVKLMAKLGHDRFATQGGDVGVAIHRVAVKGHLGVQEAEGAVFEDAEGVDLQHLDVFVDEEPIEVLHNGHALLDLVAFQTQRESHAAAVEIRVTRRRINVERDDLFGRVMGHVFNAHPAFG